MGGKVGAAARAGQRLRLRGGPPLVATGAHDVDDPSIEGRRWDRLDPGRGQRGVGLGRQQLDRSEPTATVRTIG
jgi:hypothetical protein